MTATAVEGYDFTAMIPDSSEYLNRALTEARAPAPHVAPSISVTHADLDNLAKIADAWNEYRAVEHRGPPLTLEAVLTQVLETTARLVTPAGER